MIHKKVPYWLLSCRCQEVAPEYSVELQILPLQLTAPRMNCATWVTLEIGGIGHQKFIKIINDEL